MKRSYLIIVFALFTIGIWAQNSKRIKELENQRKTALQEIETTSKLLIETKQTTSNLMNRLDLLIDQINARKKVISLLNEEIKALDEELKVTEKNIHTLEKELAFKKGNYATSLQKMQYNRKVQDKILFIFSANNLSQSYRRLRYLKEYATWQKIQGQEIMKKHDELEIQKKALARGKREKLTLLHNKENESNLLQREEENKQKEVSNLKKQENQLQVELTKKKKQADALNRQIEKAIQEEIDRAENARMAAEEKARKSGQTIQPAEERIAESSGGYAMTKEERTLSTNFASNKGLLPYPVKGRYKIVGRFGQHKHMELKYVTTNNNGIEIQTTPNNEARSIFDGVVSSIFVVPGYNYSVIIRHGNYLTVYSNLQEVYVKSGAKVSTEQAIGKIFTDTENGNSTILHFELWKERTKLNPEGWLD